MARINHVALKVRDLETATKFYENVFGFRQVRTGRSRGHISRHLTDGYVDLALMVYDSEDDEEAKLVGEGPAIHHFGIEVDDRQGFIERIEANGGTLLSKPELGHGQVPLARWHDRRDRRHWTLREDEGRAELNRVLTRRVRLALSCRGPDATALRS